MAWEKIGNIRGKDGQTGALGIAGRDGLPGVQGPHGSNGVDGTHGLNGKDGLGFDDFEELYDGERTFTHRYRQGDRVKEFVWKTPIAIHRGVWIEGKAYDRGDQVTWAGSTWNAKEATVTKPGDVIGAAHWVLAVKKGRDGRDGKDFTPQLIPVVKVGK